MSRHRRPRDFVFRRVNGALLFRQSQCGTGLDGWRLVSVSYRDLCPVSTCDVDASRCPHFTVDFSSVVYGSPFTACRSAHCYDLSGDGPLLEVIEPAKEHRKVMAEGKSTAGYKLSPECKEMARR
jgi:hypothetical protein